MVEPMRCPLCGAIDPLFWVPLLNLHVILHVLSHCLLSTHSHLLGPKASGGLGGNFISPPCLCVSNFLHSLSSPLSFFSSFWSTLRARAPPRAYSPSIVAFNCFTGTESQCWYTLFSTLFATIPSFVLVRTDNTDSAYKVQQYLATLST